MSLADAGVPPVIIPGPRCSVCRLWERLDTREREWLTARMADEPRNLNWVSDQIKLHNGVTISGQTLLRHFRGECKCR